MIVTVTDYFPDDATSSKGSGASSSVPVFPAQSAPPITILGIPFDNVTTSQTIAAIEEMVASRKPHYLATANVDFLVQAKHDVELRRILLEADLVLCDGTPLVWASRLLGNPLPERVAGSDLVPLLLQIAEKKNYRIFFLGGSLDAAAGAAANSQKQHPELVIAGHYSPPFAPLHEMNHSEIREIIQQAKPDLLFVAFGCPKQEKWIAMHYRSLGVPVCVGVGATIDFLAGKVKRAPRWMQKTGTEWTFRVAQEPRRLLGRYVKCLGFFGREIVQQWWRMQLSTGRRNPKQRPLPAKEKETWKIVKLPDRLDAEAVRRDGLFCEGALASSRHCLLDLSETKFMDSTGIGLLISLQKKARITGKKLLLVSPTRAVNSALKLMRLREFFLIAHGFPEAKRILDATSHDDPALLQNSYFPSKPALFWRGEITAANVDQVWQITEMHIASRPENKMPLQIDLSSLEFIDSSGVGLMLRARKKALAKGLELKFIGARPGVRNVLRISNLESLLLGTGK